MIIVTTTVKGHVVIPADIRKKHNIRRGTKVGIEEGEGNVIILKPLSDDPVEASRGLLKGKSSLLKALKKDRGWSEAGNRRRKQG